MANRQIYQLNTRTIAATDVIVSQDAAGSVEAGKSTVQSLKEFTNGAAKRITINLAVSSPTVTPTILENDTTATITAATNPSNGLISITFSDTILTSGKTQFLMQNINSGAPYIVVAERSTTSIMLINIFLHDGTQPGTPNLTEYIFTVIIYT
jgi:hypothetical protein